jgi:hypothetical protein
VRHGNILYFAHPVFRQYRSYGAIAQREFIVRSIHSLLGDSLTLSTNLLSTGRVTLTEQPAEHRYVLHLLYAPTVNRGGKVQLSGASVSTGLGVEVIEALPPLHDVEVTLNLPQKVKSVRLVPEEGELVVRHEEGRIKIVVPKFSCHQMIELQS